MGRSFKACRSADTRPFLVAEPAVDGRKARFGSNGLSLSPDTVSMLAMGEKTRLEAREPALGGGEAGTSCRSCANCGSLLRKPLIVQTKVGRSAAHHRDFPFFSWTVLQLHLHTAPIGGHPRSHFRRQPLPVQRNAQCEESWVSVPSWEILEHLEKRRCAGLRS